MIKALAPLVVLVVVATACNTGGTTSRTSEIIIASDLPFSGGPDVPPVQQAIEFAIREQGSIAGFSLGYMPFDDSLAGNPSSIRGVGNVERMIAERRVLGMIGPFTSGVSFQAIPVANASDLAMVSPSATESCLTYPASYCDPAPYCTGRANCTINFFRVSPRDPLQGRAMARYAAANLKVSRVAAINESGSEGNDYIKEFTAELVRTGGELVLYQDFDPGTANFTGFLNSAKAKGAQAIYVIGYGSDGVCSVRAQMNTLLPEAYFLGADSLMDSPQCIKDAPDGVRMLATFSGFDPSHSTDPSVKTHVDAYRKAYPRASDIAEYTFAAYDCTRILIDAIARAIQSNHGAIPTRAQVVAALAQTKEFKGVTGTYSFDVHGDALAPLMSMFEVQNNKWVFLNQIDASMKS